jgi:hypothetical protein
MMVAMEQTYHRRSIDGTWNPKQIKTDKERIIALKTTITKLKAAPATKKAKSKSKTDKWAWKKVPPPTETPHTIMKCTDEYHWCPKHKAWCIHRPEVCRLEVPIVANETVVTKPDKDDRSSTATINRVQNDPVLQSIMGGGRIFA